LTEFVIFESLISSSTEGQGLWTALALIVIAGFVAWLLFFSGNGTFQSFLEDLKGQPKTEKRDPFPVPVFDKSKLEVPLPPKPVRKPLTYQRTADEIDLKLDTWARDLRQSLREVRAESQGLVEKYKDVPLRRAKPEAEKKKPAAEKPEKSRTTASKTSSVKGKSTTAKKSTAKPKTGPKTTKSESQKKKNL
jgi:hypothetical protein